jgi:hypothetical protein
MQIELNSTRLALIAERASLGGEVDGGGTWSPGTCPECFSPFHTTSPLSIILIFY